MAQLNSPGVSVTVIDESFYTPAAPGTVPLIIVASEQDKQNSAGTGIAPGTLKANAGKVYLLTSQLDLGTTFGVPYFQTDAGNNPVHAGELNEYGLQAAYSYLGVSNRAYVVRSDLNTKELIGTPTVPTGAPVDGTWWFDTAATNYGVFEWNSNPATALDGQTFSHQRVTSIDDATLVDEATYAPLPSVGAIGDYAMVCVTTLNILWYKKPITSTPAGTWVKVGSPEWCASQPVATGTAANATLISSDTFVVNGHSFTGVTTLDTLATLINNYYDGEISAAVISGYLNLYSDGTATMGISGDLTGSITLSGLNVARTGLQSKIYLPLKLAISAHTSVPEYGTFANAGSANGNPSGSVWIKTTAVNLGADWIVKQYNATTATWITEPVKLFPSTAAALAALDPLGGGINLPVDTLFVKYNDDEHPVTPYADFKIYYRASAGQTAITSAIIHDDTFVNNTTYQFFISASEAGSSSLTPVFDNTSPGSPGIVTYQTPSTGLHNAVVNARGLVAAIQETVGNASLPITVVLNSDNTITIKHTQGGEMYFVDDNTLSLLFTVGTTPYYNASAITIDQTEESNITWANSDVTVASLWGTTVGLIGFATPSPTPITNTPADGRLWYDTNLHEVDIMFNNGSNWVGYKDTTTATFYSQIYPIGSALLTDPNGPIISASQPARQSLASVNTGGQLANGDIWIDPQDTEAYPMIYKFNGQTNKWVLMDNTDHTTSNGIIFADARWNDQGAFGALQTGLGKPDTIVNLLSSNFVDPDCPDPALYPKGTLLFNLRRSGFNVKKYVTNYIDVTGTNTMYTAEGVYPEGQPMTFYSPDRWVSDAPNDENHVGQFGRKAQRAVVLKSLLALINENQNIRQPDTIIFNLLSCPGYLETTSALISLNTDNGETAFIVADTPARLTPDATSLSNWGNNAAGALIDGEVGLIENYAYSAVWYPWGYSSDLLGNFIVVPPSHIMLRTIALSDNVSYPWFAPAGVRRGGVTNASSVGYVEAATGEFKTVALNHGQRDTLAAVHVNPITYLAGQGLLAYGQKTRQLVASSLDRINVARLVIYMRYQLNIIAKPFIFEPNDKITRNEIKQQIEKFLLELVGQRALYDYLVVCDSSNNTPSRIDANELHVDIAIEPVKAVEFIYIPLRLENTGAIKGLGK
jgi:hypothetical protein